VTGGDGGSADDGAVIFTIGHSTRTISDFVTLLRSVGVDLVVDIRSFPRSRANPRFDISVLPETLATGGIDYRHLAALGGRRHRRADAPPSPNVLWREASFRNYADYAQTADFRRGLDGLLDLAREHRVAIMCAEAVWWRCHRRIVADYLLARGAGVEHILGAGRVTPAVLTPSAKVEADGTLEYLSPP
jgi:uncharacterized protein (DUF488 family)